MKLYKNLAEAVVKALYSIFHDKMKADRVVEALLQSNKKWGSRDRRFVAKYIYDSVRWYRLYYEVGLDGNEPKTEADWWKLLATAWVLDGIELPEWPELMGIDKDLIVQRNTDLHTKRVVYTSVPDWFDELGVKEFGEKLWTETIEALNLPAKVVLRVNTLKTTRPKLLDQLARVSIEAKAFADEHAIILEEARNLTQTQLYHDGCFEIQDYSSQQVVPFLNPRKGSVIVDACAGAGGKALHLAAWMQNRGFIKALDIDEYKLKELEKRAKRASAEIITTQKLGKNGPIPLALHEVADYLLLDVPCSGTGVIRRNPDAKWKLSPEFIQDLVLTQRHILTEYQKMLKPGAAMLYATCSILPDENERQVAWFLKEIEIGKSFTLLKEKRIMPQDQGFDGFYMALLLKNKE
jgi:16S rRNA (cytosine967-C5)-methyltransferase